MNVEKKTPLLSANFESDVIDIIESGRRQAYNVVASCVVATNWRLGRRIVEEEQRGERRAQYGSRLTKQLADRLVPLYGNAYSKRNLEYYRQFYMLFGDYNIVNSCVHNLSWTHFRIIMRENSPEGRLWYMKEASEQMWSTRTLERNVSTQYYGRRMASMRGRMPLPLPVHCGDDPLEYLKNPVVAEFMGFTRDAKYTESELEQALITNLEKFVLELGRGFAFVARQQHVTTQTDDFYIDLVFYNFKMKRFVIFELKTHKLTHQDIGQLDMYVRMYDDLMKDNTDNPTIGDLLCTDTDSTIAKYSVLSDNGNLFAAKYMAYMPTEDELRREIEQQKRFFMEQHGLDAADNEKR